MGPKTASQTKQSNMLPCGAHASGLGTTLSSTALDGEGVEGATSARPSGKAFFRNSVLNDEKQSVS